VTRDEMSSRRLQKHLKSAPVLRSKKPEDIGAGKHPRDDPPETTATTAKKEKKKKTPPPPIVQSWQQRLQATTRVIDDDLANYVKVRFTAAQVPRDLKARDKDYFYFDKFWKDFVQHYLKNTMQSGGIHQKLKKVISKKCEKCDNEKTLECAHIHFFTRSIFLKQQKAVYLSAIKKGAASFDDCMFHVLDRDMAKDFLFDHRAVVRKWNSDPLNVNVPMYLFLCQTCHRGKADTGSYDNGCKDASGQDDPVKLMDFVKTCIQTVDKRKE